MHIILEFSKKQNQDLQMNIGLMLLHPESHATRDTALKTIRIPEFPIFIDIHHQHADGSQGHNQGIELRAFQKINEGRGTAIILDRQGGAQVAVHPLAEITDGGTNHGSRN